MESNIRALKTRTKNLQEEAYQLTHKVLTNIGEKVKAITTMGKENMKEPVPRDLSPMPFLGHLKNSCIVTISNKELDPMICFCDHERRAVKGSYMGFADFLQVRYEQQKIDDTTRERRYYEWVAKNYEFSKHWTLTSTTLNDHYPYDPIPTPQGHQEHGENKSQPIRPRPCNYSFEEWLKIKIGHNNLHESDREFIFNEWILDSYDVKEEYAREIGNLYSKKFDKYNRVFSNEIEHLSNEHILRIGKKGYVLDDVWEKCQQNYKKTNEAWHGEGYEEDEICFICITVCEDEALPLGRVNEARFKAMIRKELDGNKIQKLGDNYRDRLDS
ncbi:hypothetical protein Tco_0836508 [Tanacetum coccineum]